MNTEELDLSNGSIRKELSTQMLKDIDSFSREELDDGPRTHLGASEIGRPCSMELWLKFRWCFYEEFDGRMLRLFNRGHEEETRIIRWLRGVGIQVWNNDLDNNKLVLHSGGDYSIENVGTDTPSTSLDVSKDQLHVKRAIADGIEMPQYRISDCEGHFGGSIDGVGILPPRYRYTKPVLIECKTNTTGRAFNKLLEEGFRSEKKIHVAQTDVYGTKMGFEYVLYVNVNKNDDQIHLEIEPINSANSVGLIEKARRIITSPVPPAKLSLNPTFHKCTYCAAKPMCHGEDEALVNCRSCSYAKPIENKQWHCGIHEKVLNKELIQAACDDYLSILRNPTS